MYDPRKPLVVVAEDDPLLRLDACLTLEDEGFTVIEAADGTEALDAISANPDVDALFTDVQMPGPLCGLDLAWRAQAIRPRLRVVVTSGTACLSDADLPRHGRFFAKPYELRVITRALRAVVA